MTLGGEVSTGAAPALGEGIAVGPEIPSDVAVRPALPVGCAVDLPGRGVTFLREVAGPEGAPVVVLLHGWSVTADLNWFPAYAPLGKRYRVLALDHRGHGRGIRPANGVVRLADCADDVAALLDVLGIEQAAMVGYSMGGPIAQLVWHRHRDRVAGLVLCATARHFQGGPVADLWYRSYGGLGRLANVVPGPASQLMDRLVRRRIEHGPGGDWMEAELRHGDPAGLLTSLASLGRFNSSAWIAEVDVPTASVITTRDRTVSPRRQQALADAIPEATVHLVDGPHDVCATDPSRFLPAFLDACASVTDRL